MNFRIGLLLSLAFGMILYVIRWKRPTRSKSAVGVLVLDARLSESGPHVRHPPVQGLHVGCHQFGYRSDHR